MKVCQFVEKDNLLNMAGGHEEGRRRGGVGERGGGGRGRLLDWNAHEHRHRITPGYLKGNFTA